MNIKNIAAELNAALEPLRAPQRSVYAVIGDSGLVTITIFSGSAHVATNATTLEDAVKQARSKLAHLDRVAALKAELRSLGGD